MPEKDAFKPKKPAPEAAANEAGDGVVRTVVSGRVDFAAELENFQGPLDLLLYLIKENEIEITAVSLAAVVKQYILFIERAREWDLQIAGEFLVMAATLLELKSRELLPVEETEPGEEELIEDPRSELVRRLLAYRRLKEQARDLEERATRWGRCRPRGLGDKIPVEEEEVSDAETAAAALSEVDLYALFAAYERVLKSISAAVPHEVVSDLEPVEVKIERIERILRERPFARFFELVADPSSRADIAGTFSALLELVRRRALRLRQGADFGEIEVHAVEEEEVSATAAAEAATAQAEATRAEREKAARQAAALQEWRGKRTGEAAPTEKPPPPSFLQIGTAPETTPDAAAAEGPAEKTESGKNGRRRKKRLKFQGLARPEDIEELDTEEREIARRLDAVIAAADEIVTSYEMSRDGRERAPENAPPAEKAAEAPAADATENGNKPPVSAGVEEAAAKGEKAREKVDSEGA